jgi:hypothetical protein
MTTDTAVPAELDATIAAWVQAAKAASDQITYYTGIRDRAIEHVKNAMGDATEATVSGQPAVSWAWSKPAQYVDRKNLEADLGADVVAAKYLKEKKPARPFKIILGDA